MENNKALIPFEGKEIRKVWQDNKWYFSIVDVIGFLTDSPKPTAYWNKVQKILLKENQIYPFWMQL